MMSLKLFEDVTAFVKNTAFDYSIDDLSLSLHNGSTPVIDTVYGGLFALSGGALTVDLTSLARTGRTALDLTGKTIYGFRIHNLGANPMTFVQGASNGYAMFAATNGHPVGAGGQIMQYQAAGFGVVGGADLAIDVSGTTTQTFRMQLLAGTAA